MKSKTITSSKNLSPVQIQQKGDVLLLSFNGNIINYESQDLLKTIQNSFSRGVNHLDFQTDFLQDWDSSLLVILYEVLRMAKSNNIHYSLTSLPDNLQQLLNLAFAVDRKPSHSQSEKLPVIERIGQLAMQFYGQTISVLKYLGAVGGGVWRFLTASSIMRKTDFLAALEECGPQALAIVALISFLVGLILAFVGAVQLQTFGAQIYVASLVTIGMCRIMGAIMVGIIMAGRTGSAYAATIGTMQVNEELDALQTMGLSHIDFLVMPRLFSLLIAMPILTMLADFMGMMGGAFVGVFLMNLPYQEYWKYAFNAFNLSNFSVGIFHGFCFGFIIAICGCYCGLTCGRNADSVGLATTRSVVTAIVWMIVVTGIITVICQELGI